MRKRALTVRWAIGAFFVGAIVGALVGSAIGWAAYTPDPDCAYFCFTQGGYLLFGAILGTLFGPFSGLMLWAFWALWAASGPRRTA